ncbi:MAG: flagellar basal-body MS-ring/collar protein FliF [Verrucomicrobiota bacterium]
MKSLLQQLRQLWMQLGLNQRVTIAVAALLVFAGMVALLVWSQRPQMQLLYGRLSQKDIAAVMSSVQELGVKSEIGANGTALYVPGDQVHKVRMHLASKGIPSGEGVGFEIFDRANFGVSDFIQRTNYSRALQGELSRTIAQLQGVRAARVLVVMPENRLLFTDAKSKPTASVFIEGALTPEQVNSIRFLVANSVENLKADDVAVVDHKGQVLTEGLKDDPALGTATSQMRLRRNVEDYFSHKVESMLAKVLGEGKAVVRVSAELDTESTTRSEERFDPDGQVVRNETATDDTVVTNETDASQQPAGASANTPQVADNGSKTGKNSETQKKNKTTNYEINKVTTNSVRAPGTVTRLTASVVVAAEAQPRDAAKLEALRKMVANALGVKGATDQDVARVVTLEEMPFPDFPKEAQGLVDTLARHSDLLRDAGSVLVALILFGAFVRMLRKTKPDEIPMEMLYPQSESSLTAEEAAAQAAADAPPPVTVDLINEMIRRKPENVGAALRNWMTRDESGAGNN